MLQEGIIKLLKLALLITPEDKSNKQQNQAIHFFFIGNQNFSTDLIFRSQQIWGDKKHASLQLWLMTSCALSTVVSIEKGC